MESPKSEDQETPENILEACLMALLQHKAEYPLIYGWFLHAYTQQACSDAHFPHSRGVGMHQLSIYLSIYLSSLYLRTFMYVCIYLFIYLSMHK